MKVPFLQILYNNSDITEDVTPWLESLQYTDNSEGKADEIVLKFDDSKLLWHNTWYPSKADSLDVSIGYEDVRIDCGRFQIDCIELEGAPFMATISGISAAITSQLRTRKSFAHENKTLRQIAKTVADANGLALEGTIDEIRIERTTQNRETDLSFLSRLAGQYGHSFSIKGGTMYFTNTQSLDAVSSVASISIWEVSRYNLKDGMEGTYSAAASAYRAPSANEVYKFEQKDLTFIQATAAFQSPNIYSEVLEIRTKAENPQQARVQAQAAVYVANRNARTANIQIEGNPLFVAGNNVDLIGFGQLSGKYAIVSSRHTISKSGYKTDLSLKQVGSVSPDLYIIEPPTD